MLSDGIVFAYGISTIAQIALTAGALTSIGTTIAQAVDDPKKPPGVPNWNDPEISEAQKKARRLAQGRGRRGTTLTSQRGLAEDPLNSDTLVAARPRLLGDTG